MIGTAAVLSLHGSAAPASLGRNVTDDILTVEVCSDDTAETAADFLRSSSQVLSESGIRLRIPCAPTSAASIESTTARFVTEEDSVALQLLSPSQGQSTRPIPWLKDTHHPLEQTLVLGKAAALALLLESVTADLRAVGLRRLPSPPSGDSTPARETPLAPGRATARPAAPGSFLAESSRPSAAGRAAVASAESPRAASVPPAMPPSAEAPKVTAPPAANAPAGEPKTPSSPAALAASEKRSSGRLPTTLEVSLPLAGIQWMPPSAIAPQLETSVAWGGRRWSVVADGELQLDSSFAIEGRSFHTAGYGIGLGIRRTVLRTERFRWDADAVAAAHLSRYRRDDVEGAQTHQWSDFGVGLHSRVGLRLTRHVSAILSIGVQAFPTARLATIEDGPSRRVNVLTLSSVAGFSFDL